MWYCVVTGKQSISNLYLSILQAFADKKSNVTITLKFEFGRIENIVRKPFSTLSSKAFFLRVVKSRDFVVKS